MAPASERRARPLPQHVQDNPGVTAAGRAIPTPERRTIGSGSRSTGKRICHRSDLVLAAACGKGTNDAYKPTVEDKAETHAVSGPA